MILREFKMYIFLKRYEKHIHLCMSLGNANTESKTKKKSSFSSQS